MKNSPPPYFLCFALALAISLPAIHFGFMSDAQARPGSILSGAQDKSKREHKQKGKTQAKRSNSNNNSKSNNRTTTTRTTTQSNQARPQGQPTATGRTRPHQPSAGTTTTTTRTRTQSRHSTRRPTSRRPATRTRTHRRTTVHHHHYEEERHESSARRTSRQPRRERAEVDSYFTLGLGYGGFASNAISDLPLPGTHFNLALGAKGKLFGFELGFNGSGHTFDPGNSSLDLSVMGLSGDFKLQPSFSFVEPYLLAGLGGYYFQDGIMNEDAMGGAFRAGFGVDFRFSEFAISARYLLSLYGFSNDSGLYHSLSAQTESVGLNMTFYF